jgi:hypothetical protein
MNIKHVSEDLFKYLMDRVQGADFEQFAKRVFSSCFDESFVPLGGLHDGGADGLISSYIQQVEGKVNTFVQFTTTASEGARKKISDTIKSLRKAGREPKQLIYATTEPLPKFDTIASEIFDSYDVFVSIRDLSRLLSYVQTNAEANTAFFQFFSSEITNLSKAADLNLPSVSTFAKDPTVFAFLNHELRDRFVQDKLNTRVLDALIYWALRHSDPEKNIFLKFSEISEQIQDAFPVARNILLPHLEERLKILSKKEAGVMERLRYYKAIDSYCLSFEMRTQLSTEVGEALIQQERFQASVRERIVDAHVDKAFSNDELSACCQLVFSTVHEYFVDQGLLLAAFLEGSLDTVEISDQIVEDIMAVVISRMSTRSRISPAMFGSCLTALRGIFYHSTLDERAYMRHLSRTSCLLVTMRSAPKLLEYLNKMGGNFKLFIGTDLIIKAISERYLTPEHRQVTNLLSAAKKLGSELILTEPVLTEFFTHLHAADLEFRNHYASREQYLKIEDLATCDRILIRAYLHARKHPKGPNNWRAYVNQLTDPEGLRSKTAAAKQSLQGLLSMQLGMKWLSYDDLISGVDGKKVDNLAARLDERRSGKHEDLSYNDALLTYAVYARRNHGGETAVYDGFGYKTWWLTKETKVLQLTGELVRSQNGIPYIMRPEFLLNFVALAPKAAETRKALADLLPTTAGLQIGHQLSPDVVKNLLKDVAEWSELSPERAAILLHEKITLLTHTRFKTYSQNLS